MGLSAASKKLLKKVGKRLSGPSEYRRKRNEEMIRRNFGSLENYQKNYGPKKMRKKR